MKDASKKRILSSKDIPEVFIFGGLVGKLAAARAVLFAQLVDHPGYQQGAGFKYGKNKNEAAIERKRLFKIIEDLMHGGKT